MTTNLDAMDEDASIAVTITVTDVNEAPTFDEGPSASRNMAENTAAGQDIGAPVTATDPEDDGLTYSLGGADQAAFSLDTATGQLQTKRALDYETKSSYAVTITVRDGKDVDDNPEVSPTIDDTITVTITVTDVNDFPVFTVPPATRLIAENTPVGQALGSPFTATDDDDDSLTYSLDPASATIFTIDKQTGQMQTKAALDHEAQPRYAVIVLVSDGKDAGGNPDPDLTPDTFLPVTVTVTDAPAGSTCPPRRPESGRRSPQRCVTRMGCARSPSGAGSACPPWTSRRRSPSWAVVRAI